MIIEISVLIMAIAVAVLVIFLVQTMRKAQASIETANETLKEARDLVHSSKDDVEDLVISVRGLVDQVNKQISAIDPLMLTVRDVGTAAHELTNSAKQVSVSWMDKLNRQAGDAVASSGQHKPRMAWLDWLETGVKTAKIVSGALQSAKQKKESQAPVAAPTSKTTAIAPVAEAAAAEQSRRYGS
ncbi:DUF948 domain-containing protein [Paenibacillus sp. IB182496]|uniref:DUF948 domain-containing protein n=1 Tax=Paenibacillus sabuli TaxID=2772509 RepID=A0A927BQK5_9BACL|nr:DUF948 domain-containing protein [Paenibacillus sabuli]MBD2844918.1 DUF948 domain-containing protein [Paenibacillus sabuli]